MCPGHRGLVGSGHNGAMWKGCKSGTLCVSTLCVSVSATGAARGVGPGMVQASTLILGSQIPKVLRPW